MAERVGIRRHDPLAIGLGFAAAAAAALAGAATRTEPWLIFAVSLAGLVAAFLAWRFGRAAPSLVLLAVVPLVPVGTIGFLAMAAGGLGSALRSALMVGSILALVIVYRRGIPKPAVSLRPLVAGLLALAALGAVVAVADITEQQGLTSLFERHAGQPLIYAGILVFLSAQLRERPAAREWMLIAFSLGVWAQAGIVASEFASGAAFDAVRGFTRAQGTVGANFVSALAMMAFFIGMAERRHGSPERHMQLVGGLTMVASVVIIVGVVARGGVFGLLLGFAYLIATDARVRRRASVAAALVAVAVVGSLFTPAADLWSGRLSADSARQFDRPATWISGVRIGLDNPLTGLGGEPELVEAIDRIPEYRSTPLGPTSVLPHNSWILAFAEGGTVSALGLIVITLLAIGAVRRRDDRSGESRFYIAALIGISGIAMINNVFRHPELMLVVLFLLALVTAPAGGESRRPGETA